MPRLTCLCGESISLSAVPNPQGFKLIWEPKREQLIEDLIAAHQQATSTQEFEEKVYNLLYPRNPEFPQIYECPKCGRLAVFARASDTKPAFWFELEQTNIENADSLHSLCHVEDSPKLPV
ncbi:hypothetical protein [Microseira sp. BLCC-F43]|jgi:hypothetical protein|uniref:hypothetical protein n=1 Tax=Microseira sp. BLCC-F43 TaxID=3153602 RepID=UPI0035B978DD